MELIDDVCVQYRQTDLSVLIRITLYKCHFDIEYEKTPLIESLNTHVLYSQSYTLHE